MINTVATFALGALLAAFAIWAARLNEGQHAARRRGRARQRRLSASAREARADLYLSDLLHSEPVVGGDRRLPAGDFLFGALALRGYEPFLTRDLAAVAADSGLDISQVLAWLAKAEESGIVERLDGSEEDEDGLPAEPSVRLTAEGLELARENRRGARRSAPIGP